MDSYPWEPAQTTSGIIKDPNVGKRVVPPTVRKDGSQRKELRIREGYVPIEDRIAYKSRGKLESERMKGFIPGATSATPSTYAIPTGKTNDPTAGMSKAQKKNYQRKVKRMEEKTARNWDSESDDEEGEGEGEAKTYDVKRDDSDQEPNDRFDIHRTSSDERLDREIDAIEIPELGKKPEFGIGFNKYRDPIKGPRKEVEVEEKKEEKKGEKEEVKPVVKAPRPGGIFRDLGLKPKSSATTPTLDDAEKVKLAPVVSTKPKRTVPGASPAPGPSSTKPPADKNAPRQRPEVRVRPGMGLAGMMKQLAVQDSTPSVRR